MVSREILEKHALVSFSKTPKLYESEDHTTFVDFSIFVTHFALLFEINCTEVDQSQSSIISMYIIN